MNAECSSRYSGRDQTTGLGLNAARLVTVDAKQPENEQGSLIMIAKYRQSLESWTERRLALGRCSHV